MRRGAARQLEGAVAGDAPRSVEALSIAGSEASDDWVLIATACAGATARANRPRLTRPPIIPTG